MYPSLLPPNATPEERALEQVMAHVGDEPIDLRTVKNFDLCPVSVIPALAWEMGVTYWEDTWTEDQRRSALKSAAAVNKLRGTTGAVKRALKAVGRPIDVIQWYADTPVGAPYTFRVVVNGYNVTADELQLIVRQVADAKNGRSYMSDIRIGSQTVTGNIYAGGACVVKQTIRIKAKRDE